MGKLLRIDSGERGRPRTNKGDKKGNVRIVVTLPGVEGNMSKTMTIQNAKVSEVFSAIEKITSMAPVAAE